MTISIPDKAKVNAKRYIELCYPKLLKNASLPSGFISLQDGAPAHTAKLAQDWIATSCSEFTAKMNGHHAHTSDANPLDYQSRLGSSA